MNCVYRTYSHLFKIRVKHKTLQHGLTRNASQESGSQHRHKLLIATYISFGIGGVLLTAIVAREIKRMRLSFKGIQEMNVPAWRRVKLYKYKDTALPGFVVNQLDDIENFEVRDSDVWVVSFPRSGNNLKGQISLCTCHCFPQRGQRGGLGGRDTQGIRHQIHPQSLEVRQKILTHRWGIRKGKF